MCQTVRASCENKMSAVRGLMDVWFPLIILNRRQTSTALQAEERKSPIRL